MSDTRAAICDTPPWARRFTMHIPYIHGRPCARMFAFTHLPQPRPPETNAELRADGEIYSVPCGYGRWVCVWENPDIDKYMSPDTPRMTLEDARRDFGQAYSVTARVASALDLRFHVVEELLEFLATDPVDCPAPTYDSDIAWVKLKSNAKLYADTCHAILNEHRIVTFVPRPPPHVFVGPHFFSDSDSE